MANTDNLKMELIVDGDTTWGDAYRAALAILDANPGIALVADEAAMLLLDTWAGRMIWRIDEEAFYRYSTSWEELETGSSTSIGAAMQTIDDETSTALAAEGTDTGYFTFAYYPSTGTEMMLLQAIFTPRPAEHDIVAEGVTLNALVSSVLAENQPIVRNERVIDLVVYANAGDEVTETDEEILANGVDTLDKTDNTGAPSITGVKLTDLAGTACVSGTDYSLVGVDALEVVLYGNIPEVDIGQENTIDLGGASGGTFLLGDGTNWTAPITWNASDATIQTALEGLALVGVGNVTVSSGVVTFAATLGDMTLSSNFTSLTGATAPNADLTENYQLALQVLITYDYLPTFVEDTDYEVSVTLGITSINRKSGTLITDGQTVLVDYSYEDATAGFKIQFYDSDAADKELLYELDTDEGGYTDGDDVKDPNFGYMPICYYINSDGDPRLHYVLTNHDPLIDMALGIELKYKPLI